MEAPNTRWHPVFISEEKIDEVEKDFDEYQEDLLAYIEHRYTEDISEYETPESIALTIGNHAKTVHGEHINPRIDDTDPTEKDVILAYIGAYAMDVSN